MPMSGVSYPAQPSTLQHVYEGNNRWQCQWFHHVGQMTTCASAPVSGCPLSRRQRCRCTRSWCCLRGKARFRFAFRFHINLSTVLLECSVRKPARQGQHSNSACHANRACSFHAHVPHSTYTRHHSTALLGLKNIASLQGTVTKATMHAGALKCAHAILIRMPHHKEHAHSL